MINNLRAGRNSGRVSRILRLLGSYPDVRHVETDHEAALPEAIDDLARREVDLLVVNGGDGTLQHALTEILTNEPFEKIPLIAPLPGGRTNATAVDLRAHRNPFEGVKALLQAVESWPTAVALGLFANEL